MLIFDFEITKYDWMIVWLDTETRKMHSIVNDKEKFAKFYEYYKHRIWVGYNSRSYDTWIAKAILCGFNPYEMSKWIIEKKRKGHEFSKLLYNYPILGYDAIYGFKSLKELEGYMGHDIRESSIPFDIDRPLTDSEIKEMLEYCRHDVMETFHVFVESSSKYSAHVGLVTEFGLDPIYINKTPAQLSAIILGAVKETRNDEFDISMPDTLRLGKYQYILDHFMNWAKNVRDYEKIGLDADIMGVPHTFGVGGIHGAKKQYYGSGFYLMADVDSYYPQGMIQYKYLSRNVKDPSKFVKIRDNRLVLKSKKDPRQESLKLVINGTFGASKDKYNNLYDPLQANNLCIANQLFLVDLLDKLEGHCELIQLTQWLNQNCSNLIKGVMYNRKKYIHS